MLYSELVKWNGREGEMVCWSWWVKACGVAAVMGWVFWVWRLVWLWSGVGEGLVSLWWSWEGRFVADGEVNDELVTCSTSAVQVWGEIDSVVDVDESFEFERIYSRVRNQDI